MGQNALSGATGLADAADDDSDDGFKNQKLSLNQKNKITIEKKP